MQDMQLKDLTADEIYGLVQEFYPDVDEALVRVDDRVPHTKRAVDKYQGAVLYALVKHHQPKRILEIGTALGYSAAIMAEAAPDATIITLNPLQHEVDQASRHLKDYPNVTIKIEKSWDFLRGYAGEKFDFIFIDGDHKRVRMDFAWWEHLSEGGVFLFHDYSPEESGRPCPPVFEAVNELTRVLGRDTPDIYVIDNREVGLAGFVKDGKSLADDDEGMLLQAHIHSTCTLEYLKELWELAKSTRKHTGDIVECGVQHGGSAAVLAVGGKRRGRKFLFIDSFEGIPEPDLEKDGAKAHGKWARGNGKWGYGGEDGVHAIMEILGVKKYQVAQSQFGEGDYPDIEKVVLLHIDATIYESTKAALEQWVDKVAEGGLVVVHAYNHWMGVRRAVDEFLAGRDEKPIIMPIEKGVWWRV